MRQKWRWLWTRITAYALAVLVTAATASAANRLLVQAARQPDDDPLTTTQTARMMVAGFFADLPLLVPVVALALLPAFLLAGWLKPMIRPLAPFATPLAGWAAMALALAGLRHQHDATVMAGAATAMGLLLISLSGLVGGILFALLRKRRLR